MRELNLAEVESVSGGHVDGNNYPWLLHGEEALIDGGTIGGAVAGTACASTGAGLWISAGCALLGTVAGNAAENFVESLGEGITQMQNADQTFDPFLTAGDGEETLGIDLSAGQHGGHGYSNGGNLGDTPMGGGN